MSGLKRLLLFTTLLLPGLLQSQQVTIDLFEPTPQNAYLPELYRLSILNNSSGELSCYLRLTVEEDEDGVVGAIRTSSFDVPTGTKQISASNYQQLEPVSIEQSIPEYEDFTLRNNTLPPGRYLVCVTIYLSGTDERLDEDCYRLNIESYIPPYLIAPANMRIVTEERPFFTWSPSSPAPGNGSFSYLLLITEILDGQSPVASIKSNRPWFVKKNIFSPVFQYPVAARPLQVGQQYAWQITTLLNDQRIASSEVWWFRYMGEKVSPSDTSDKEDKLSILPPTYHSLSRNPDGGYRLLNEPVIRFTYNNPYNDEQVTVNITDMSGNIVASNILNQKQNHGINFNTINTAGIGVKREELYKLKLTNGRDEVFTLNFQIREEDIKIKDLKNLKIPGNQ